MKHKKIIVKYKHPHAGVEIAHDSCSVCHAEGRELTTDCPGAVTASGTRREVSQEGFDFTEERGWFYHERPRATPRFEDDVG